MGEHRSLVRATVVGVNDASILYPSCIQCYAKMLHNVHSKVWQCVRCSTSCGQSDLHWRYRLSLCVADSSASCNLVLFGGTLAQHFGCGADQFHEFLTAHQGHRDCLDEHILQHAIQTVLVGNAYIFCLKTSAQPPHSVSWQTLETQPIMSKPLCLAHLLNTQLTQQHHSRKQSDFIAVQMIHTSPQEASEYLTVMDVLKASEKKSGDACLLPESVSPESLKRFQDETPLAAGRQIARSWLRFHRNSLKGRKAASGAENPRIPSAHSPHLFERGISSCSCFRCAVNCTDSTPSLSSNINANNSPTQSSISSSRASAMFSCQSSMDQEFAPGISLTCSDSYSYIESFFANSQRNQPQSHTVGSDDEIMQKKFSENSFTFKASSLGRKQSSLTSKSEYRRRVSGRSTKRVSLESSWIKQGHQDMLLRNTAAVDITSQDDRVVSNVTNHSENFIVENSSANGKTVLADFSSAFQEIDNHCSLHNSSDSVLCEHVDAQLENKIQPCLNVSFKGNDSSFSTSVNDSSLLLAAFELNENLPQPMKSDQPSHFTNEQLLGKGSETYLNTSGLSLPLKVPVEPVTKVAEGTSSLSTSIEMPDSEDLSQFLSVMAEELAPADEKDLETACLTSLPVLVSLNAKAVETSARNCQVKGFHDLAIATQTPCLPKASNMCSSKSNTRPQMSTAVSDSEPPMYKLSLEMNSAGFKTSLTPQITNLITTTTKTDPAAASTTVLTPTTSNSTIITRSIATRTFKSAATTRMSKTKSATVASSSSAQIQTKNQSEELSPEDLFEDVLPSTYSHVSSSENSSLCDLPAKSLPPNNDLLSADHSQSLKSLSVENAADLCNHLCQQSLTHKKSSVPTLFDMPDSEDLDVFLNNLDAKTKSYSVSKEPQDCCLLMGDKCTEKLSAVRFSSDSASTSQTEVNNQFINRKSSKPDALLPDNATEKSDHISVVGDSLLDGSVDLFSSQSYSQTCSHAVPIDFGVSDAEHKKATTVVSSSLSDTIPSSDHLSNIELVQQIPNKTSSIVSNIQSDCVYAQPLVCSPPVTTVKNSTDISTSFLAEDDLNIVSFSSNLFSSPDCTTGEVEGVPPGSLLDTQYNHRVYHCQGTSETGLPKKVRFSQKRRASSVKMIDFRLEKYNNPMGDSQLPLPTQLTGNPISTTPRRSCLRQPLSLVLTPINCSAAGNNSESLRKDSGEQYQCTTSSQLRKTSNLTHSAVCGTGMTVKTKSPVAILPGPQLFCSTPSNLVLHAFPDTLDCSGSQDLFSPVVSQDLFGVHSVKESEMTGKLNSQWSDGTFQGLVNGMESLDHRVEKRFSSEGEILNSRSKKQLSYGKKHSNSGIKKRLISRRENVRFGREKRLSCERECILRSGREESIIYRRENLSSGSKVLKKRQKMKSTEIWRGKRLSFEREMLRFGMEKPSCGTGRGSEFNSRRKKINEEGFSPLTATPSELLDAHRSLSLFEDSVVLLDNCAEAVVNHGDKESLFNGSDELFDDSELVFEGKPPHPDQISTPCYRKTQACVSEENSTISTTTRTSDLSIEAKVPRKSELYSSLLMSPDLFSP